MEEPVLKGFPASAGVAEGIVRVVPRRGPVPEFQDGEVLVTEMTEPAMVMMMNKAAAIVTDIGGITSHAAIVSRELGVPCVTATKLATTALRDGMRVRVDGTKGEVHLL